ncbi:MAG: hypothetical protein WC827_01040 [Candidatus Paceibacterota bacterium]|jgi:hypothetical protein
MDQPKVIGEERFRKILKEMPERYLNRAVNVLNNFGPLLSFDVANVMLHATNRDREDEVLIILEKHWEEHLKLQHPDIRGTVESAPGVNKTKLMFLQICRDTLVITPIQSMAI